MAKVCISNVDVSWKETLPLWFFSREPAAAGQEQMSPSTSVLPPVPVNPHAEENLKDVNKKRIKKTKKVSKKAEGSLPPLGPDVIDSCDVCRLPKEQKKVNDEGESVTINVIASLNQTFSDQVLEVLMKVLLVSDENHQNQPAGGPLAGKIFDGMITRSLWLCKDCTNTLTSLTDLYFQLEDLREEFNVLRRRVGRTVIVSSLSKSQETFDSWEEEVKAVEDIFPSAAVRKVFDTKKNNNKPKGAGTFLETEETLELPVLRTSEIKIEIQDTDSDFPEYEGDLDNMSSAFGNYILEPTAVDSEKNISDKDPKLSEMIPTVILQRCDGVNSIKGESYASRKLMKRSKKSGVTQPSTSSSFLQFQRSFKVESCLERSDSLEADEFEFEHFEVIPDIVTNQEHEKLCRDADLDQEDSDYKEETDSCSGISSECSSDEDSLHPRKGLSTNICDNESNQQHACYLCPKIYPLNSSLLRHIRQKHPGSELPSLNGERKPKGMNSLEYTCKLCSKTYATFGNVRRHVRMEHPGTALPSKEDSINIHDSISNDFEGFSNLESSESESEFSEVDESTTKRMKNNHTTPRARKRPRTESQLLKYACNACSKKYRTNNGIVSHILTEHPGSSITSLKKQYNPNAPVRTYPCPSCSEIFLSRGFLKRHASSCNIESLQCTHCDMTLSNAFSLRAHRIRMHLLGSKTAGDMQCNFCLKFFYSPRADLKRHKREYHIRTDNNNTSETTSEEPESLKIYCSVCSVKVFYESEEDLREHEATEEHQKSVNSKARVHCNTCRINFGSDVDRLQEHLKSEKHSQEVKLLGDYVPETFCVPCRQQCSDKRDFGKHNHSAPHQRSVYFRISRTEYKKEANRESLALEVPEKCSYCGLTYHFKGDLESHMERVHKDKKGLDKHADTALHQKSVAFRSSQSKLRDAWSKTPIRLEEQEKCVYCGQTFSFQGELESHMERVHKDRTCEFCGKSFVLASDLLSHRKANHNISRSFVCEKCGKHFETEKYLRAHANTMHYNLADAICPHCGKVFPSIRQLLLHEKNVHTVLSCSYCPSTFRKPRQLRRHLYREHKQEYTKDSPFVCLVCYLIFPTAEALNDVHMPAHLRCPWCPKIFGLKQHLEKHLRVHTGERPFNCSFCDKSFAHKANLKVHELGHEGQKPHTCDNCGNTFASKSILIKHKEYCSFNNQSSS